MENLEEKRAACKVRLYQYLKQQPRENRFIFSEDETFTFGNTADISESLAQKLYECGVRKGDLVALRATRTSKSIFLTFALHILGAIGVLTDAHSALKDFIDQSGVSITPAFYLTDEEKPDTWILKNEANAEICRLAFDISNNHSDAWAIDMEAKNTIKDPALIVFTSGSTGKRKAVKLCQSSYITNSVDGKEMLGTHEGDIIALILPLHHVFALTIVANATYIGHSIFIPKDLTPEYMLSCVQTYKVTGLYSVPTYLLFMAEHKNFTQYDVSSLRIFCVSAGPFSAAQAVFIEKVFNAKVVPVYGMSEYIGICSCPHYVAAELRTSGVGYFSPLHEGRIINEQGKSAADFEEGEVCVRGPELTLGYYNDEAATREAIDEEGWLHTGDLAYRDNHGIIHICGRKKDIIIRAGENISAGKIERALLDIAGIAQTVVIAAPDRLFGEVPSAMVVLRTNAVLTEEEIKTKLLSSLLKHEVPVKIIISKSIPLTASGKVDKQTVLKSMI